MYYVNDTFRKQSFGPFSSKHESNKSRTQVRMVSDLGLELGTNVSISNSAEWPVGDYNDAVHQNTKLADK